MLNTGKRKIEWGMLPVIFSLAWPTMLEQLMQTAVQYIDTAMVGALGTEATAAVGSTGTINWLIGGTIGALGIGFLAYIAKAFGQGEEEKAKKAAAQSVLAVLVSGIFFTVLTLALSGLIPTWMQVDEHIRPLASRYFFIIYAPMLFRTASTIFGTILRAAGDAKTPMRVGLLTNLINIVLNFLLIYPSRDVQVFSLSLRLPGAGLGVTGAAIASAIAFTVGGSVITVALWRHPLVSPRGQSLRPDIAVLRPCFKVALPNMLQRFATSFGYVAFAAMINSLGEVSTAAHTIANTVESLFYIPGYGMQTAAATLAGNALGAGDKAKMRSLASMSIRFEVALMIVSGALLFIFAPVMMGLFSTSQEVIALGATVLRMVAVSEPFFGLSIVMEGMLQGVGNTVSPFVYNILGMWGVRIVGTLICTQFLGLGLVSAWACMIAHNLLLCALYGVQFARDRWHPLSA